MSSDVIVVLKADHKDIRDLFRKFQAAGDKAVKKKAKIAGQIIELPTVDTYIENEVMYPEVCALIPVALAAIASVVLLGVSTASVRLCRPVNAVHTSGLALGGAGTCQPSPPVPAPRHGP
jgi:hypothetical protein